MERGYISTAVALVIAGFLIACLPTNGSSSIKEQVIAASVQIDDYCSGTIIQSDDIDGDGVYVNKILTAKHCFTTVGGYENIGTAIPIHHFSYIDGVRQDDTPLIFFIEKYNDGDLALLTMYSTTQLPSIPIATQSVEDSLEFGEDVLNVSFPGIIEQFYREGFLGHINLDGWQTADLSVMGGSSGSSLVTSRRGTPFVIGVLRSMIANDYMLEGSITQWSSAQDIIDFIGE